MQPYRANIILYAESPEEVKDFEAFFYNFVNAKRSQGLAVSAKKLKEALTAFQDNVYVNNFLKM